jgi:acetate---CoA ligase (ADP-forming)
MKLEKFLNPKYIAVIGASSNKNKVGRKVFDNALGASNCSVFPINNKEKKIAGHKAYGEIGGLPINDWKNLLVVFAIPAKHVLTELKKCTKLGVKNIIIISAGFKEASTKGLEMEKEIMELAFKENINVLGPNCLGFINNDKKLNVSFSNFNIGDNGIKKKNNIAFLSQSGAIGSAVLDWVSNKNIGLSYFVSLGNKAVLNENDFLEFLERDSKTDLVILYLEEISQGERFLEIATRFSKEKPVAILKSGRTDLGEKMTMSHTGSMAGSYDVVLTAFRRAGIIVLDDVNQLFNLMRLIKSPAKNLYGDLAIVSNAGGPSVLAVDKLSENNTSLAVFSKKTKEDLKKFLPIFCSIQNPLDILGDACPERYEKAIDLALSDKKVSSLLIILTPQSMTNSGEVARAICKIKDRYKNKMIVTSFLGGPEVAEGKKLLAKHLIPNFDTVEEAVDALSGYLLYLKNRTNIKKYNLTGVGKKNFSSFKILDYLDGFKLLKDHGIKTVPCKELKMESLGKIKYPITIKFTGPDFVHKTDEKAIFLNIENASQAKKVLQEFKKMSLKTNFSDRNIAVYQPMEKRKMELIIGLKRDSNFGPILLLGLGGIYTEVYKDIVLEIGDLNKKKAFEMIKRLKVYPILKGVRGEKGLSVEKLADAILALSKISKKYNDITEMEINPLFIDEEKVLAVDVRVIKGL